MSRLWHIAGLGLAVAVTALAGWKVGPGGAGGVSVLLLASSVLGLRKRKWRGNDPDGPRDPARRRALRTLGAGMASSATLLVVPEMLRSVADEARAREPKVALEKSRMRVRQWAMIIDLRRCDGCQSVNEPPRCTTACIEGHYAPEPMEWIQVYEEDLPGGGSRFVPAPCMQCQNPPCVNVCPVSATWSTPEGVVLIDQDRCIGCRICMAACPYDRRFFNWGAPPIPPEALLADYSPEQQVPARKGTVMKCDFCPEMARSGHLPFCVQACPNGAIYYGDLEENLATNGREVVSFTRFVDTTNAFRWKEDLGTEPRVWYIPGHGELVGRDPLRKGRLATRWPWVERVKGAVTWTR